MPVLNAKDQYYLQVMEDLNKTRGAGIDVGLEFRLHDDQIEQLKPLYQNNIKDIFLSCGRKWGKTELVCYMLWRHALLNPGSACYYVAPESSHASELIWSNNRLQKFLGKDSQKYIKGIQNQKMIIRFNNDSYIRCIGSENYMVANGLTPGFAVYDEFKGFNPKWHVEFAPNRAAKAAPLIIIGTKPRIGNRNMEQYDEVLEYMRQDPDSYVADRTTFDNPINHMPAQKKIIDQEIAQLIARGEDDVVQLEYYSKRVPGGKRAIFPMLDEAKHQKNDVYAEVKRDVKKMEWFCVTDPGTTTCFAALIGCVNPYTRKIYILDEIYEKDQNMTSVRMMYPRLEILMKKYYPGSDIDEDWCKVFDEAAAWFSNEVMQQYGIYFIPTAKHLNKKEEGLSLVKDILIHELIHIDKKCESLWKEMREYAKDDRGMIPKKNDHLIDCLRYLLGACNYNMVEALEVIRVKHPEEYMGKGKRYREFEEEFNTNDWSMDGFDDWMY